MSSDGDAGNLLFLFAADNRDLLAKSPTPTAALRHLLGHDAVSWMHTPSADTGEFHYLLRIPDHLAQRGWWVLRVDCWDEGDGGWDNVDNRARLLHVTALRGVLAGPCPDLTTLAQRFATGNESLAAVDPSLVTDVPADMMRHVLGLIPEPDRTALRLVLTLAAPRFMRIVAAQASQDVGRPR